MKLRSIKSFLLVVVMSLPRSVIAYPFYTIGAILPFRYTRRLMISGLCLSGLLFFFFSLIWLLDYMVSPTAFFLAFALHAPFLLFIAGGKYRIGEISAMTTFRILNLSVFVLSILNMIIFWGFPLSLPYIHYPPDAYGAFFGLGGAKIVTIVGFFGIMCEIFYPRSERKSWLWLLLAGVNFVAPSYLIGTVCGLAALGFGAIKQRHVQMLAIVFVSILFSYIQSRLDAINSLLSEMFGYHPKILAIIGVAKMYIDDPVTLLIGSGLGQFSSTAAEWGSDFLNAATDRVGLDIPGLSMSYFHDAYLGPYLLAGLEDKWAISSSMNKPYTSLTTIFAEFGLVLGLFVVYRVWTLVSVAISSSQERNALLLFLLSLFVLDVWHDNFWFMFCLLIYLAGALSRSTPMPECSATVTQGFSHVPARF